MHMTSV